ncbi:MAG: hypothetical protein INR64_10535, partial [Caulobacteraceae bacterium]|nr:hypothetical protein [Caulobacter sp.]
PTLDYFLSSADMEPPGAEAAYSERLVRLPGLSTPARTPPAVTAAARGPLGLRDGACVFWCAQSPYKYLPRHDAVFARIAEAAGDCQFAFSAFPGSDELTLRLRDRLARAFAERGLDAGRFCVILPRLAPDAFASAMAASDVVLDSLGWSGCNSLLEALACGLPAITLEGGSLRARHGAALLRAAGSAAFVCTTVDDYVALAVRLARDPRARRRNAERPRRLAAWLSSEASTRALEDMLTDAVRRHTPAGAAPSRSSPR